MKKRTYLSITLALTMILTMLVPFAANAAPDATHYTAQSKIATVTVDGTKEALWNYANEYEVKQAYSGANPETAPMTYRVLNDADHFYFWIEVVDADIAAGDAIRLNIDETNNRGTVGGDANGLGRTLDGETMTTGLECFRVLLYPQEEGLQTCTSTYWNAGPWHVSGCPVDCEYYVTHTATGYTMEVSYGFEHDASVKPINNGTDEMTYVSGYSRIELTTTSLLGLDFILEDNSTRYGWASSEEGAVDSAAYWGWVQCTSTVVPTVIPDNFPTPINTEEATVVGQNIALEDSTVLRFYVDYSDTFLAAGGTVTVTIDRPAGMEDVVRTYDALTDGEIYGNNEETYYYYSVSLAAKQLTDEVTIVVKDGEGNIKASKTYTVEAYCYATVQDQTASENWKAVCTNLAAYGASAQTMFGYRTDKLATYRLGE